MAKTKIRNQVRTPEQRQELIAKVRNATKRGTSLKEALGQTGINQSNWYSWTSGRSKNPQTKVVTYTATSPRRPVRNAQRRAPIEGLCLVVGSPEQVAAFFKSVRQ